MAQTATITSSQKKNFAFLKTIGESKADYTTVDIEDGLVSAASVYIQRINDELNSLKVTSSGKLAKSHTLTEVEKKGNTLQIGIKELEYGSYINEGVDGWFKKRGSRFKFKTKGVGKDMASRIKEYLIREGKMSLIKNKPVNQKEKKRSDISDTSLKAAKQVGFMIKKYGIKPNKYFDTATKKANADIRKILGESVKISIQNNILK